MIQSSNQLDFFWSQTIQKYFNIFVFFLPLGFLKVGGMSLTFLIFCAISLLFVKKGKKLFKINKIKSILFILFYLIILLSYLFQTDEIKGERQIKDLILLVQYSYWTAIALFLITWSYKLDFYQISRSLFWGTVVLIVYYYTLNPIFNNVPQNFFSFSLVLLIPSSMFYTFSKYSFKFNVLLGGAFLFMATMSQSRTGTIIVLFELIIIFIAVRPKIKKSIMLILFLCSPMILLFADGENITTIRGELAEIIEPYNPRAAELIESEDSLSGQNADRSWLTRKLMVQKGLSIFNEYPLLGIGIGNFTKYQSKLDLFHPRFTQSENKYNTRSAHNTYIQILAEIGIFSLLIFMLMISITLYNGISQLLKPVFTEELFIVTSFIGMAIYFYVISALPGAITWFILGLGMSLSKKRI